jgi:hypothetical protein
MDDKLNPNRIELLDDEMVQVLRSKTPIERVAMVLDANRTMRLILESRLRELHPEWDQDQIAAAVAQRLLRESD